jgi:exonuclease III
MEQLKWMRLRFIESETPHIIMGDFNSLRADDFSREYLAKIGHERAQSNWESPQFDVTAQMIEWGYTDVFKRLNPRAKDLEVETNHYHTRIDFIWVSEVRTQEPGVR